MHSEYKQFEYLKEKRIPSCERFTRHSKTYCEIYNNIINQFGIDLPQFEKISQEVIKGALNIHQNTDKFIYLGIEVELENYLKTATADPQLATDFAMYWQEKEDGSLRNRGREFVSRFGLLSGHVLIALTALEKYVTTVTENRVEANARTGLHVHIDVSTLTSYNLCNLLFLYSIFEPLFFHVSGGRNENIFCVPWETNKTTLGQVVKMLSDPSQERHWRWRNYSKYCGLNLSSIATYGTIEFRMHKGTYKAEEINKWAQTIINLYLYAEKTDLIENLNKFRTKRHDYKYWDVFAEIFGPYSKDIENLPMALREELLTRCKYSTINFFKHFIDYQKMPDSVLNSRQPENDGAFDRDWNDVWRAVPREAIRDLPPAGPRPIPNNFLQEVAARYTNVPHFDVIYIEEERERNMDRDEEF